MSKIAYLGLAFFPWIGFFLYPIHNLFTCFSALLASFLLCLILKWGMAIKNLWNDGHFQFRQKFLLALVFLVQIVQLGVHYPGLISGDDLNLLGSLMQGVPSAWHSFSYSLVIQAMTFIFFSPVHLSISFLILSLLILFFFLRLLPGHLPIWAWLCILLLFCSPQMSVLILYQNRDSLNSLLLIWLGLIFVARNSENKDESWFGVPCLFSLTFILSDLRQEGKIYLFLVCIYWVWTQKLKGIDFLKFFGKVILAMMLITFPLMGSYSDSYRSTTLINPLSEVFHQKGLAEATPTELIDLNRYFKVSNLLQYYNPVEIDAFHHDGIQKGANHEDFEAFRTTARKIILRNLPIFFENRKFLAATMLDFRGEPYAFSDDLSQLSAENRAAVDWFKISGKPAQLNSFQIFSFNFFDISFYRLPEPARVLWSSCFIPLLAFVFFIFCWHQWPELWWPSVIHLSRLAVVILFAPAAYFKYVTSFWMTGWLFLIYFFIQYFRRHQLGNFKN